ncbi:hypothetical protein CLV35_2549 [Motilibacter peucedani]|uniref:Uncharacterized protein n=1 Tax=Motilibacter peucedani TaxID=598650 RepID=A0A420XPC3_9ACTN|nr:hypothetical protein [Motilibacter peucedani]RKS74050.1 hypothetical protein CLV35_2549 [Motilibacter peucedani]
MPTPTLPTAESRWRCARCGNLTRFDVTRRTRTVEFWHFDLPGEPQVEVSERLDDVVERVRCRWCESADDVELVLRTDADPQADPQQADPQGGRAG